MTNLNRLMARHLLQIHAIKLQPEMPFTWASGWRSPIYTDNRTTLSHTAVRSFIKVELARLILENFPQAEVVAGVATGAIAMGALVADELDKPYIYVRSTPKDHGLENLIEGNLKPGQNVVVVEDLVSTGSSSLKACDAIKAGGGNVVGMVANFTYEFPVALERFRKARVKLMTLSNYKVLIEEALESGYIKEGDLATLHAWREDPENWTPSGSKNDI